MVDDCKTEETRETIKKEVIVTDQGSNVQKAARIMKESDRDVAIEEYPCSDHKMHNGIEDAFKADEAMSALLQTCKSLASFCNRSTKATTILKRRCQELGIPFKTLKNPGDTRSVQWPARR